MDRIPRATDTNGLLLGDLAPGARVGEYVVERAIATRGTGNVYEATHRLLPRRVCIKVVPAPQLGTDSPAVERLREACIVEALDHPGIPRIYECGFLADRRPWIASELVDGTTVASLLQTTATLRDAAAIVRDVAEILEYVHLRGLVHRNVVPQAIVFPSRPRRFPLCLVDWSGARTLDSRTPLPMRPPSPYLAPDDAVDERADIFALGVIGRELLEHTRPDARPPIFAALVKSMTADDPAVRPLAHSVREHATWLVEEIERAHDDDEPAIPQPVREERTEVTPHRMVTSEVTPETAGEIDS